VLLEFTKNINGVDFGQFGKKSVHLNIKLKFEKDEWKLYTWFAYILHNDGKMSPVDRNVISLEFVTTITNNCIDEVKALKEWKHG